VLGAKDLTRFIEDNGVRARVVELTVETPSVEAAAQAVGVEHEDIVKSLLFLVDSQPVLAIACGQDKVDRRRLAEAFGVSRKRVELAPAEAVLRLTGYAVGAMPPFGHRQALTTVIDPRVLARRRVYAGGGEINTLLEIDPAEIARITRARTLDLSAAEQAGG
jgi:Cys-tRNA(Pro) deacylase